MLKRWAWGLVKPLVMEWIAHRALHLSEQQADQVARQFKVSPNLVKFVADDLRERALLLSLIHI